MTGILEQMFPYEYNGERYTRRRTALMAAAKAKGTHSKYEWQILSEIFGICVGCGISYSKLHGRQPTKDHITPINAGGCDCIGNLQPVCRNCNSSGFLGDRRSTAKPNWAKQYITHLGFGWCEL